MIMVMRVRVGASETENERESNSASTSERGSEKESQSAEEGENDEREYESARESVSEIESECVILVREARLVFILNALGDVLFARGARYSREGQHRFLHSMCLVIRYSHEGCVIRVRGRHWFLHSMHLVMRYSRGGVLYSREGGDSGFYTQCARYSCGTTTTPGSRIYRSSELLITTHS
jgi:hypothetical protein